MHAALASVASARSRASTPANAGVGAPPVAAAADLDPLRLRLVQLIDAVTLLHSQLEYLAYSPAPPSTAHPGLLPFPDLVARYSLLLTNLSAVQNLLSSEQDKERQLERERREGAQGGAEARRRRAERDRDLKREKWDSLAVVPAHPVDEAKDWVVGTLLRTKQIPEVEAAQTEAAASLPEPFASALTAAAAAATTASSSTPAHATPVGAAGRTIPSHPTPAPANPAPPSFPSLLHAQARLLSLAHNKVLALKEFNSENEEWDWKARVELDPAERDEGEGEGQGNEGGAMTDDGDVVMDKEAGTETVDNRPRAWTAEEVQTFLRTGRKPAP